MRTVHTVSEPLTHSELVEMTERFRNHGEEFVTHILTWLEETAPEAMAHFSRSMEYQLRNAFEDAQLLDENAKACGQQGAFLRSFLESVFCDPGFSAALVKFARVPLDRKSFRTIAIASSKGRSGDAAIILWEFRGKLKNGFTSEDALRCHGKEIGEELAKGNLWLLERLAESVRHPYRPSARRWILRAWLPLALWQNVTPSEREARIYAAWSVAKPNGASMPDWPKDTAKLQAQIRVARQAIESRFL